MATEWRRSGHIERIKEPKNQENKKQEFNSLPANPAGSAGGESELLVMIPKEKSKRQKAPTEKTDGSKVWDSYAAAYEKVWNAPPVRNAKSNKICAELVKRLGAEEAPLVAAFYPTHRSSFYVQALHPLTLLARDCEKLRTEWVNGQTMTSTFARQIDKSSALDAVFERQIAKVRREESAKNDQPS